MDQAFSFQVTPLDPAKVQGQVSLALRERTDLLSRQKYPRLWRLADRLGRVEKAPADVLRRRRKLHVILGLVNWVLSLFLLLPGFMDPAALWVPLLMGGICFGASVGILWRNIRRILGILNTLLGTILCLGGLCSLAELGCFLPLGVLCLVTGIAALRPPRKARPSAFDRAAEQLLQGKDAPTYGDGVVVTFSQEEMSIGLEKGGTAPCQFPYADFELILETKDLLIPICDDSVMVLQKKDLRTGSVPQLREFLGRQVQYICVSKSTEAPSQP